MHVYAYMHINRYVGTGRVVMRNEDTGYIYKSFINRRDKHRSEKAVL
jgi:hypothetical protein